MAVIRKFNYQSARYQVATKVTTKKIAVLMTDLG